MINTPNQSGVAITARTQGMRSGTAGCHPDVEGDGRRDLARLVVAVLLADDDVADLERVLHRAALRLPNRRGEAQPRAGVVVKVRQ